MAALGRNLPLLEVEVNHERETDPEENFEWLSFSTSCAVRGWAPAVTSASTLMQGALSVAASVDDQSRLDIGDEHLRDIGLICLLPKSCGLLRIVEDRMIVLFCDGYFDRTTGLWGAGIMCGTSGRTWACGGDLNTEMATEFLRDQISENVICLVSILKSLLLGRAQGVQIVNPEGFDTQYSWTRSDASCRGSILCIVPQDTRLIGVIQQMFVTDGKKVVTWTADMKPDARRHLIAQILTAVSQALEYFERIVIKNKAGFLAESTSTRGAWPPYKLAKAGAFVKRFPIKADIPRWLGRNLFIDSIRYGYARDDLIVFSKQAPRSNLDPGQ